MKFELGQEVVVSQQKRRNIPPVTMPGKVIKVGRKYVTVSYGRNEMHFDMYTGVEHTEYPLNYRVWESMQAFEDYYEAEALRDAIRYVFCTASQAEQLGLDTLRRIKAILENNK